MTWKLALLAFAGTVAAVAYTKFKKSQPQDFTHVHKLQTFRGYEREVSEEQRRRLALCARTTRGMIADQSRARRLS